MTIVDPTPSLIRYEALRHNYHSAVIYDDGVITDPH